MNWTARAGVVLGAGLAITLTSLACASKPKESPADLILTKGRVWTADPAQPWAEAVAVRGNSIAYVGPSAGAEAFQGPQTQVLDVSGRLVTPGFNDAHVHMMSGALSLERVDLIEEQSLEAVQAKIKAFAEANPGHAWVLGRGWLYGSFPGGLPTKAQLDAVVSDRPAYMECYDGHSGWANSKALAAAGITKATQDPVNGVIVRDPKTGEPTGALKESATALVEKFVPKPNADAQYALLLEALRLLNSQGLTSVQDAGYPSQSFDDDLPVLERAVREGKLTVRTIAALVIDESSDLDAVIAKVKSLQASHATGSLRFGTVKGFVDGVVEAHTAALFEPYSDDPKFGLGLPNWKPENLNAAVTAVDKAGLQVYLHAIGDRGVAMALDAHEAALRANGRSDRRGRVEHIETMRAADVARFKTAGVIASMQPLHANPDQNNEMVWSRNAGPDRASRAWVWKNIQDAGGRLAFGSDWPVVTSDVFRGLYTAVTRKTREGKPEGGWLPHLAVSLEDALRHYTIDAAYASFDEGTKGSLAVGKLADIAVLSQDLFNAPPEQILKTKVMLTVMDGKVVHRDAGF